ncbi:hypothetical protein [Kutzneria sp. NPDC051319]|uniref:RIFT barrel domain-containing protein n=1 Tax=Kutzneria sp. NPDC051319 TaxID=3155047 RepID=UPI00342DEA0A
MPWARGQVAKNVAFALAIADGTPSPVQSWPLRVLAARQSTVDRSRRQLRKPMAHGIHLTAGRSDNAYVVMSFGRIVDATKASGWTDWTQVVGPDRLGAFGEVDVDTSRARGESVMSLLYQRASNGPHRCALGEPCC